MEEERRNRDIEQGIGERIYSLWSKFLTWFGKLKIMKFNWLPIIAYDPEPFFVTGYDIVDVMEKIQPGDVLIRGFDDYLDGKFIPDEKGYSHAGLYVGDNEVIHSAAPCVQTIHLIDFCEADRIMVLRPASGQDDAIKAARERLDIPYDFNYESDVDKLYCFELIANCYPQAEMKEVKVEKFLGLVKRQCYIAKSIYGNAFFSRLFERNNI